MERSEQQLLNERVVRNLAFVLHTLAIFARV